MNTAIFLSGMTMAAFSASALFFIKFWKASGDRFFLKFSFACALIAIERIATLFIPESFSPIRTSLEGAATWVYLIRLLAFALILNAVWIKSRSKPGK